LFNTPTITPTFGNGQEVITLEGQAGVTGVFNGESVTVMSKSSAAITPTGTTTPLSAQPAVTNLPTVARTPSQFNEPSAIAVDALGDIYVMDTSNYLVREIDDGGLVTTFAGQAGVAGMTNGPVKQASLRKAYGIAVDKIGAVYVADTENNRIRKIWADKKVHTLAGSGVAGATDGKGTDATFWEPHGVAVDRDGNVYVADTRNNLIRKIDKEGRVRTLAGQAAAGAMDGDGVKASFNGPTGLVVDDSDDVYVSDWGNHTIRKITSGGKVTTLTGKPGIKGATDGPVSVALFDHPRGITADAKGNLYVADQGNHVVRKISRDGVVSTLAGKAGYPGTINGTGSDARFNSPAGVAANAWGSVIVADTGNELIRVIR
jgi:sugar lactone lactonase YvrE